jgi:hypothetical protein
MDIDRQTKEEYIISRPSFSRTILFPSYRCACYAVLLCLAYTNEIKLHHFFSWETLSRMERERKRENEHDDEGMHKKRKWKQSNNDNDNHKLFYCINASRFIWFYSIRQIFHSNNMTLFPRKIIHTNSKIINHN